MNNNMIRIQDLSKKVGNFQLGPLSLEVDEGEILVILGRNGSGKTTMLNLISGIMQPDQGKIYYNQVLLNKVPLEKRKVGYIFQKLYLFPHLNVFSNITFGLRHKKDRESIIKMKQIISILGIEPLLSRDVQNMSGGEQQKVAIARTILTDPLLLLMDEPFTNLDITSKLVLTQAVKTTANIFKIPTIYVTHHPNEALALADKIVILADGKIIEEGTRDEVISRPKQQFTRSFIDTLRFNNKQTESKVDGEHLRSNIR